MILSITKRTRYFSTQDSWITEMDADGKAIKTQKVKKGYLSLNPIISADTQEESVAEQVHQKSIKDKLKNDKLKDSIPQIDKKQNF